MWETPQVIEANDSPVKVHLMKALAPYSHPGIHVFGRNLEFARI